MKRLTAGLLALMLLATLLPGCGKKEQWNVDNFFLSDDGTTYSVSYRHDDGTEEVVAEMGSYPQPLTIIASQEAHTFVPPQRAGRSRSFARCRRCGRV